MADARLESIVQRMIDAGESEENIATVIRGYAPQQQQPTSTPPPAGATAGRMMPSTITDAPPPTAGENAQQALKWGGKVIGNLLGFGSAQSTSAVENPKTTLALSAIPLGANAMARTPGIIARAMEANPTTTGAVTGAVEGGVRGHGDPGTIAKGAFYGALGGGSYGAARKLIDQMKGAAPAPAPTTAPKPTYQPSELMQSVNDPDAFLAAVNRMRAQRPPAPTQTAQPAPAPAPTPRPAPAARPATAADLRNEINWRTTDAVPIDAIKRDVLNGGTILEAGESQIGLAERLAQLLKKPTPSQMAEVERLGRALRQRGHIRETVQ